MMNSAPAKIAQIDLLLMEALIKQQVKMRSHLGILRISIDRSHPSYTAPPPTSPMRHPWLHYAHDNRAERWVELVVRRLEPAIACPLRMHQFLEATVSHSLVIEQWPVTANDLLDARVGHDLL